MLSGYSERDSHSLPIVANLVDCQSATEFFVVNRHRFLAGVVVFLPLRMPIVIVLGNKTWFPFLSSTGGQAVCRILQYKDVIDT